MMKRLYSSFLFVLLMVCITPSTAQKSAVTTKAIRNIVSATNVSSPYFAIQVLASKQPSHDAEYFKPLGSTRQFLCSDGYYRYVNGQYASKEEAQEALTKIRSLGQKYQNCYVVNTQNFSLSTTGKATDETAKGTTRTNKKITLVDKATEPYWAIQILAMKTAPQDPKFFDNVDEAREFSCKDGYSRWTVGQYETKDQAYADLAKTKALSPKYKDAFVVNTSLYQLGGSAFSSENIGVRTSKRIIPVERLNGNFTIQVLALKEAPQDPAFFEKLEQANEVSCSDGFKRYTVGEFETKEDAADELKKIRSLGPKYKNAFIVATQNIKIEASAFSSNYQAQPTQPTSVKTDGRVSDNLTMETKTSSTGTGTSTQWTSTPANKATATVTQPTTTTPPTSPTDKNGAKSIRTSKKIIPVDKAQEPYFGIQLLALKDAPKDPDFFDNIDEAREFSCKDGYKRYVVGQYQTAEEAAEHVAKIRALNPKYQNAFVANTSKYQLDENQFSPNFGTTTNATVGGSDENKTIKETPDVQIKLDANKIYTIQLTASRYPFYVSELKGFSEVFEFFMPDKVYRYCEGKFKGASAETELKRVLALGYKEAFIVEWDKYAPYQIE